MPHMVVYARRALRDLKRIQQYIAQDGRPANAKAFVQAIVAKCDGLAAAPHQGTRRDDLLPGLRTTGFRRRVTIAFRIIDQTVLIAGISTVVANSRTSDSLQPKRRREQSRKATGSPIARFLAG